MKGIITTISLIGAFAILFFATWPGYQDLRDYIAKSEVREKDLERMIDYNQGLDEMIKKLDNNYQDKIKKIEDGVPNDHYVPSLFSEIEDISLDTGVKVENLSDFSEREYEPKAKIEKVEIELQVVGSYRNFKEFMTRLKNSARIISVKEVVINKPTNFEEEGSSTLEYNLTVTTYSY